MDKIKAIKLFIPFLLVTSFLGATYWAYNRDLSKTTLLRDSPDYLTYVSQVENEFVKEAVSKYGLICSSSGGSMPYDVEEVSVGFIKHAPYSLEESRNLLVTLVREYQKKINQHEKLRPFLREYPFPPERIELSLSFRDSNSKRYKDSIAYVSNLLTGVFYRINDEATDQFVVIKKESFEEAEELVKENAISLKRGN